MKDRIMEMSLWINDIFYVFFNLHLPNSDSAAVEVLEAWIMRLRYWRISVPSFDKFPKNDGVFNTNEYISKYTFSEKQKDCDTCLESLSPTFIVVGDFNLQLDKPEYVTSQWRKVSIRTTIKSILSALSLMYLPLSWISSPPPPTRGAVIIDYLCVPRSWNLRVHSLDVYNNRYSDHAMVAAHFQISVDRQSAPVWRFKNELLSEENYVRSMTSFLEDTVISVPSDSVEFIRWWDNLKRTIIQISKKCWYEKLHKENNFRNSGNFKKYRPLPQILCLRNKENDVDTESDVILERLTKFYADLYSSSPQALKSPKCMNYGLKVLDDDIKTNISDTLTLQDLYIAASAMNLAKAPGVDGLTLEFYLKFWLIMGPLVLHWYNHTMALGTLNGMSSFGVITLIPKNGDPRVISNWRPIMLLTVDMKIVCKAISTRLIRALVTITPQNQTGLSGSSIFTSLSVVRDIISISKIKKNPLCIIALDQEKAYDKVNHHFLFHLLNTIQLPVVLRKAVVTLYTGFQCVVRNGGKLSQPFPYNRGIRQGDATSTVLFMLAMQPVLNALQIALDGEGVLLPSGDRILHTTYADDVTLFVRSPSSIQIIINTFERLSAYSEASLNLAKSAVMFFNFKKGELFLQEKQFCNIPVCYNFIKILGIEFAPDLKITEEQWSRSLFATRESLAVNMPMLVNLSYICRARWATKRLWPRWAYLFKVLQPSCSQIKILTNLFAETVWIGTRHWITPEVMATRLEDGGLEITHPGHRINVLRVMMLSQVLMMSSNSYQGQLARYILQQYAGLGIDVELVHTKPDQDQIASLPAVYRAAFLAWDLIPSCIFPQSKDDILNLPAVNSKFLLQMDESVVVSPSTAMRLGIRSIRDIYDRSIPASRFCSSLIKKVRHAVDHWEFPPWPSGKLSPYYNLPTELESTNPKLNSFLIVDRSIIPMERWSNALIMKTFRIQNKKLLNNDVPNNTWRILFRAHAPPSSINHMWRFLHGCVTSPTFYFHIGMLPTPACVLCGSNDISNMHQFMLCPDLAETIAMLHIFLKRLKLPMLLNQFQLYPLQTNDHKLANFMIVTFIYAVLKFTRTKINSVIMPNSTTLKKVFFTAMNKHLNYHASKYPPNIISMRHYWDVYTYANVIAFFKNDKLYLREGDKFRRYAEM